MDRERELNNYFGLLGDDIKKLWGGLQFPQKLVIVGLIIISAAAISYFVSKSTEPNWGVLYSDLSDTDAVAVVENLKKAGYPYKVSDDKKSILVPNDVKEDLRVLIAQNDVIHDSNPGFELLDKLQLGATDFQNKLMKQRIFQGELTRTIERIQGITKARVQLADPERSIFSDQDEAPTASVMLILEPGVKLKAEQVKAIKNLVAYGIPRLTPEKVFITDQNGNPLSEEMNNNSAGIDDYRVKFENQTAKKVTDVLGKIVGNGNVSVQVSADMNFDSARATIEQYLPTNETSGKTEGVVSSTQEESESYNNGKSGPGGGPAALQVNNQQNGKDTNYQKSRVEKTFNVSKEVKQVVYAPGTVQRMTIAVALNKILTTREKDEIKNLIVSASGADEARGDLITISGMQFADDGSQNAQALSQIDKTTQLEFWLKTVGPIVVVLILGLTALFVFASLLKKPAHGEEVYEGEGYYSEKDEDEKEDMPNLIEMPSLPSIEAKLDPEFEQMKTDLNHIINADPAEAARLLLSYIKD